MAQGITWTNVDFSLVRYCAIDLRAILQQFESYYLKTEFWYENLQITATFPRGQWAFEIKLNQILPKGRKEFVFLLQHDDNVTETL